MLFALYLIYLLIMWKNVQLEQWFTSKFGGAAAAAAGEPETAGKKDEGSAKVAPLEPEPGNRGAGSAGSARGCHGAPWGC